MGKSGDHLALHEQDAITSQSRSREEDDKRHVFRSAYSHHRRNHSAFAVANQTDPLIVNFFS